MGKACDQQGLSMTDFFAGRELLVMAARTPVRPCQTACDGLFGALAGPRNPPQENSANPRSSTTAPRESTLARNAMPPASFHASRRRVSPG